MTNAIEDQPLPLYGDGLQQRDWLYVADHAGAIEHVLRHGRAGETYNIPGSAEMTNRDVVAALLDRLGKPWSLVRSVPDRPGHDRRYAMDGSKLAALGWQNRTAFARRPGGDVDWFLANEPWWRAAKSGDWDAYYERQYGSPAGDGQAVAESRRAGGLTCASPSPVPAGRLGRALVAALEDAPFAGPVRADRLGPRGLRPRRPGRSQSRADRSRPAGGRSSTRPPGRMSTAAPASRSWRCAGTARRDRASSPRPRPRAASTSSSISHERGVRRPADRRPRLRAGRRDRPDQCLRRIEAGGGAGRGRRLRARRRPRRLGSSGRRGCSVRPATTSRRRSSPPRSGRVTLASHSGSSPTRSARRHSRDDLAEGDRGAARRRRDRRHPPRRQRGRRFAGRLGARSCLRASSAGDVADRRGAGLDVVAGVDAAARGASSTRRRCPAANRCGRGEAMADYLPTLLRQRRRGSEQAGDRAPVGASRRALRRPDPPCGRPRVVPRAVARFRLPAR